MKLCIFRIAIGLILLTLAGVSRSQESVKKNVVGSIWKLVARHPTAKPSRNRTGCVRSWCEHKNSISSIAVKWKRFCPKSAFNKRVAPPPNARLKSVVF
ncbi:hypothetical protein JXJ21_22575 [candidate division KSB1 bacterium]|nr:hypothetical protein [candidate division KSB1 bacterium]